MLDGLLKHRASPAETAAGRYDLSHLEPKPLISLRCNRYQASGLVANHVSQGGCAEHAPQRSVEQNGEKA
jgi:hypothetical protein